MGNRIHQKSSTVQKTVSPNTKKCQKVFPTKNSTAPVCFYRIDSQLVGLLYFLQFRPLRMCVQITKIERNDVCAYVSFLFGSARARTGREEHVCVWSLMFEVQFILPRVSKGEEYDLSFNYFWNCVLQLFRSKNVM